MPDDLPPTPDPDPAPPAPAPAPAPTPAPPPAAHLVANGTKSEREIQLERENEKLAAEKRLAETRAAELERDNQELKKIPTPPAPPVKKEKRWRLPQPVIGGDDEE